MLQLDWNERKSVEREQWRGWRSRDGAFRSQNQREKILQLLVCNCSLLPCYKCLFWHVVVVAGHKVFCDCERERERERRLLIDKQLNIFSLLNNHIYWFWSLIFPLISFEKPSKNFDHAELLPLKWFMVYIQKCLKIWQRKKYLRLIYKHGTTLNQLFNYMHNVVNLAEIVNISSKKFKRERKDRFLSITFYW